MTSDEVAMVMARLKALWGHRFQPERGTAAVWADDVGDLDYGAVVAVLKMRASEHDSWPPSPMEVRDLLVAATDPDLPPPGDQALLEVQEKIHSVGTGGINWTRPDRTDEHGNPHWSHPAIAWAVQAYGGWAAVCAHDNPDAFRPHFLRLYEAAAKRSHQLGVLPEKDRHALLSQAPGILEMARNAVKRLDAVEDARELPQKA